jgi:hypothetical protein
MRNSIVENSILCLTNQANRQRESSAPDARGQRNEPLHILVSAATAERHWWSVFHFRLE